MTYQALARKWRPRQFSDIVGQETFIQALTLALDAARVHHAYLFTGTRGVGKTTAGRLLAMALNCERGVTASPCGGCLSCTQIIEGRFADLIEVDAASKTKVEDTRDLLAQVPYLPTAGRYKVYLIDEVHMFSNHSFNALLKTLEEPPAHVVFILATTDPEKLPKTIISRCLHFPLRTIPETLIALRLGAILQQEGINFDATALGLVAKAADGSLRDALSLLEPMLGKGSDTVLSESAVAQHLGWPPAHQAVSLLEAILAEDSANAMEIIKTAMSQGIDPYRFLTQVLEGLHHIAVIQALPQQSDYLGEAIWTTLATQATPEMVQLLYQLGLHARRDFAYAPTPRQGLEMAILRMIAFMPKKAKSQVALAQTARVSKATMDAPTPVKTSLDWPATVARLPLEGMSKLLVENCVLLSFDGQNCQLGLDESKQIFYQKEREQGIAEALSQLFAKKIVVKIQVGKVDKPTPVEIEQAAKVVRQKAAQTSVENDPTVRALVDHLAAEIVKIEPVDNPRT